MELKRLETKAAGETYVPVDMVIGIQNDVSYPGEGIKGGVVGETCAVLLSDGRVVHALGRADVVFTALFPEQAAKARADSMRADGRTQVHWQEVEAALGVIHEADRQSVPINWSILGDNLLRKMLRGAK
jgi:hypothetical protein